MKRDSTMWPENILKSLRGLPLALSEDQMNGLLYAISTLPSREKSVIKLYFEGQKTHKEIGELIGVSTSRVAQIKMRALRNLRHPSKYNYVLYGYQGMQERKAAEAHQKAIEAAKYIRPAFIEGLDLRTRAYNVMKNAGLNTVADIENLIKTDPDAFVSLPGLGPSTRAELLGKLEMVGVDVTEVRALAIKMHK